MNLSNFRRNIIPVSFTVAVFSLVWRQGNTEASYVPKLFEGLIVALVIYIALEFIFSKEARTFAVQMQPIWKSYGPIFSWLTVFMVVGTAMSLLSIPQSSSFIKEMSFEYIRSIFSFLLFFMTAYIVFRYKNSTSWFLGALVVSPLIFYLAFSPKLQDFFVSNTRLIGAQADPNYTASFISLGIVVASTFYLYTGSHSRWLGGLFMVLLMPLFLWAHSRGMIIAIAITLIILSAFYLFRGPSWKRTGRVFVLFGIIVFSVVGTLFILPQDARVSIYRRSIVPIVFNETLRDIIASFLEGDNIEIMGSPVGIDSFASSRGYVWRDAFYKTIKAPMGFGPAYQDWSPLEHGTEAHNLWFEVSFTAGWGGLLLFFVFLNKIFRSAAQILKEKNFISTTLPMLFLLLLLGGVSLDIFTLRWLWLIIGMVVGYAIPGGGEEHIKNITSTSLHMKIANLQKDSGN